MMRLYHKLKKGARAGFSMIEMIAVIAVLAILAGVAVPGMLAILRNLKMLELDNAARSIYVAAQNRMSELYASGELRADDTGAATTSTLGGAPMTGELTGFPAVLGDWADERDSYFCLSSTDAARLLPAGSIDTTLTDGTFFIEYNAKTGMIYSVFYAETGFSYDIGLPRDRDGRLASTPMLGYYGGDNIDFTQAGFSPIPSFTFHNGEELFISLTVVPGADYTVKISDGDTSATYTRSELDSKGLVKVNSIVEIEILLDSLKPNKQFTQNFGGVLTPGADIKVTVTATQGANIPMSYSDTENSLFAAVSDETPSPGNETAKITHCRHLQNLRTSFSSVTDTIIAADLSNDLSWSSADISQFSAINNDALIRFSGGGNGISDLNAPLFGTLQGTLSQPRTVRDIRLINTRIQTYVSGSLPADERRRGTLANTAVFVEFTNCQSYAQGSVVQNTCALNVTGSTTETGGLIGYAENCVIRDSLAALTVLSSNSGSVGGLAGGIKNTTITRSYACTGLWDPSAQSWAANSGILMTGGQRAGGLVGFASGGSMENCYAIGNISAIYNLTAAGFAGRMDSGASAANSYSAITYDFDRNSPLFSVGAVPTTTTYGFAYSSGGSVASASCYFFNSNAVTYTPNGTGLSFAALKDLGTLFPGSTDWVLAGAATTNAYGRTGESLPYPRLEGISHYGDWSDIEVKGVLYYYEKYDDGTFRYDPPIDSRGPLKDDTPVTEDGYLLLLEGDAASVELKCRTAPSTGSFKLTTFTADPTWESFAGKSVYPITAAVLSSISGSATAYYQIEIGDINLYFNPDFAKTNSYDEPSSNSTAKTYEVRTARQLAALGAKATAAVYNQHYLKSDYNQTRDIDFRTYASAPSIVPIGSSSNRFVGNYNGNGHSITITDFSSGSSHTGLFGRTSGTIEGVNIVGTNAGGKTQITAAGNYAGALIGAAEDGNVLNCSVVDVSIDGATYVGGLIGSVSGSVLVNDCSVSNVTLQKSGSHGGGFAGQVTSGSTGTGIIANCSVQNVTVTGTAGTFTAGFVGSASGGVINGCSVTDAAINGASRTAGFAGSIASTVNALNCTVTNITVSGTNLIGGFAGEITGTAGGALQNIFVTNALLTGTQHNVGGFAGSNSLGTIQNCAVSGATISGTTNIGGFLGNNAGGKVRNCSAANGYFGSGSVGGSITATGTSTTGGFVGHNYSSSSTGEQSVIDDCYAVNRFTMNFPGGFVGTNEENAFINNSYSIMIRPDETWAGFAYNNNGTFTNWYAYDGTNSATIAGAYSGGVWGIAAQTFPHDDALAGMSYPFPAVVKDAAGNLVHYGNWPVVPVSGLYYYEKYENDTYGFYGEASGGAVTDTLRGNLGIREDGYAFLTTDGSLGAISVTGEEFLWGEYRNSRTDINIAADPVTINGASYTCFFLTPDKNVLSSTENAKMQNFYLRLTVTAGGSQSTHYFNPNFAKCAVNPADGAGGTMPAEPSSIEIRTARQLTCLSRLTNDETFNFGWQDKHYEQTRSIDFNVYTNADHTDFYPISMRKAFAGTYDGHGYILTGMTVGVSDPFDNAAGGIGLFGTIADSGAVQNVVFVSYDGDSVKTNAAASNTDAGLGVLAGINNGKIDNCIVAGFALRGVGGYTGGLVGVNTGTITRSGASNATFAGQSTGGSIDYETGYAGVGGFAGRNSGDIFNCYALASFPTQKLDWASVGAFVGSQSGTVGNSYVATIDHNGAYLTKFSDSDDTGLAYCIAYDGTNAQTIRDTMSGAPWGTVSAANSFPYDGALSGKAYPLPAVVQNRSGGLMHYGNWPAAD